jgi:hypothetical protein
MYKIPTSSPAEAIHERERKVTSIYFMYKKSLSQSENAIHERGKKYQHNLLISNRQE